jgi:translation initiation factor 2B subunit (eIF-2B alpha/beta/delta family)
MTELAQILKQVQQANENITEAEAHNRTTLAEIKSEQASLRNGMDNLYRRVNRPGAEGRGHDTDESPGREIRRPQMKRAPTSWSNAMPAHTQDARYVTLADLQEWQARGLAFTVIDVETGQDATRVLLA